MAVAHKGSISMGLVLIPIGMYKATQDNDIHFNQLDKESKARIKYKKYCSHCGKEVTASDIIKGYDVFTSARSAGISSRPWGGVVKVRERK